MLLQRSPMARSCLLSTLFLVMTCLAGTAAADPTPVDRKGGSAYPIEDSKVRMTRETIVVRGCWNFAVTVELVNDGDDTELEVAFPEWFDLERSLDGSVVGRESGLSGLTLRVNGEETLMETMLLDEQGLHDFEQVFAECPCAGGCEDDCHEDCKSVCEAGEAYDEYECLLCGSDCEPRCRDCCREEAPEPYEPYGVVRKGEKLRVDTLHLAKIAFPSKHPVTLDYNFEMSCATYDAEFLTTPLEYKLTTGAYWAGTIGTLDVDIELPARPVQTVELPFEFSLPGGKLVRDKATYRLEAHLKDYEPDQDLMVDASYSFDPDRYLPSTCGSLEDLDASAIAACCDGVRARHGLKLKSPPSEWLTMPLHPEEETYWSNPHASAKEFSKQEQAYLTACEARKKASKAKDEE
ncbi:MAG: hypothetical protein AUK47_10830 [Deltaproteobacteria bacterium CG2_30_63_29]|nr:MAG: hypothetical protein AUK47_10830 [Deltaproteobacteria bacterium CG2_30_63_29]